MKNEDILQMTTQTIVDCKATGKKARKARRNIGVSLRRLAVMMGVSAPYVSDLETGKCAWTPAITTKYTKALSKAERKKAKQ